jgi:hypothetical protein
MSPDNTTENSDQQSQGPANAPNPDQIVRQVAERVWAMWQEEMRLERERRSAIVRR